MLFTNLVFRRDLYYYIYNFQFNLSKFLENSVKIKQIITANSRWITDDKELRYR